MLISNLLQKTFIHRYCKYDFNFAIFKTHLRSFAKLWDTHPSRNTSPNLWMAPMICMYVGYDAGSHVCVGCSSCNNICIECNIIYLGHQCLLSHHLMHVTVMLLWLTWLSTLTLLSDHLITKTTKTPKFSNFCSWSPHQTDHIINISLV